MSTAYTEIEPNGYGQSVSYTTFDQEVIGAVSSVSDIDIYAYQPFNGDGIAVLTFANTDTVYSKLNVFLATITASNTLETLTTLTVLSGSSETVNYRITDTENLYVRVEVGPGIYGTIPTSLQGAIEYTFSLDLTPTYLGQRNGTYGDDRIYGTVNSEIYSAGSGDDFIFPSQGFDFIDGGTGLDYIVSETAWLWTPFFRDDGSIEFRNPFSEVPAGANEGRLVRTINVERLLSGEYNGAPVVAFDETAKQGYRIYKAAFNREPDEPGLGYWVSQMDDGMDMVEVAARFIDSPEFRSLYGSNPTNGQFVTAVYSNVLGRNPDASGYEYWINQLENNPEKTWQKVLADFSESSENQENVAELIVNGVQFDYWIG